MLALKIAQSHNIAGFRLTVNKCSGGRSVQNLSQTVEREWKSCQKMMSKSDFIP